MKLITHAEFFNTISPAECVFYVKLDECVDINKMNESVLNISSMKSLNNAHSCKFTFNLIVEHVVDKLLVCAMCITCDNLVDFKLNMLNNNFCEPYFSDVEMNKLFNACCSEPLFLVPYFSLKEGDHAESSAISTPKMFSSTSRSNQFGRYTSKTLNKLCNKKYCDIRNAPSLNFEMFNVAMMKSEILNQLCCLKEIIVLPSTMLFQAHPNKVHNTYVPCYRCEHMNMHYKLRNEEAEMIYHGNCCIYTPCAFYRLVSDQQKPRAAFLQGREDDKTISRISTNTLNIECSYKVKAIFNSKSYCFPLDSLLLGLYDYRLKHLAILEEINTTTTP